MASIQLHITNSIIPTLPAVGNWDKAGIAIERQGRGLSYVDCTNEAKHIDFDYTDFSSLESYNKLHLHYERS